ncbi:hypothetical protein AOLI_G00202460 [Acnodon oligacanthus]
MGRIVYSTEVNSTPMEVHSPVDSCTPEELRALPFLHTPVPPPTADKLRLSRLKSLLMGAKGGSKANYTPDRKIGSLRDLVRQRRNPGDGHMEPVGSRNIPEVAEFSQERKPSWKIQGLKLVSALAEHHTEVLLPELHDICLTHPGSEEPALYGVWCGHDHSGPPAEENGPGGGQPCLCPAAQGQGVQPVHLRGCGGSPQHDCAELLTWPGPARAAELSHRNAIARLCTAQHLEKLVCLLGASRLLNSKKDSTCRFLTANNKLALNSAQEVKLHACNTLQFLGSHKEHLKMVEKCVTPRDITKSR